MRGGGTGAYALRCQKLSKFVKIRQPHGRSGRSSSKYAQACQRSSTRRATASCLVQAVDHDRQPRWERHWVWLRQGRSCQRVSSYFCSSSRWAWYCHRCGRESHTGDGKRSRCWASCLKSATEGHAVGFSSKECWLRTEPALSAHRKSSPGAQRVSARRSYRSQALLIIVFAAIALKRTWLSGAITGPSAVTTNDRRVGHAARVRGRPQR